MQLETKYLFLPDDSYEKYLHGSVGWLLHDLVVASIDLFRYLHMFVVKYYGGDMHLLVIDAAK